MGGNGRGALLVISGPSGSGKSSICKRLLDDPRVQFSISATTRTPRDGEVDGVHYRFVDEPTFRRMVAAGEFVEWAQVHDNLYGTLRGPLDDALASGRVVLVEIDVQGGEQLKAQDLPGVFLFISPPDMDELRRRLVGRGTDAPEVVERRLKKAHEEMEAADRYDHVVVNDDLESALSEVRRLAGLDAE